MAEMTYRQALHDTLREELQRDENVFLMGEEIGNFEGSYKITAGLLKEFGARHQATFVVWGASMMTDATRRCSHLSSWMPPTQHPLYATIE